MSDPIQHMHAALSRGLAIHHQPQPVKLAPKPPLPPIKIDPEEVRSGRSCIRKKPYASAQEANEVMNQQEAVNPGLKLYAYKCQTCHKWHLTKSKP